VPYSPNGQKTAGWLKPEPQKSISEESSLSKENGSSLDAELPDASLYVESFEQGKQTDDDESPE
jgi:hypothetical protein